MKDRTLRQAERLARKAHQNRVLDLAASPQTSGEVMEKLLRYPEIFRELDEETANELAILLVQAGQIGGLHRLLGCKIGRRKSRLIAGILLDHVIEGNDT